MQILISIGHISIVLLIAWSWMIFAVSWYGRKKIWHPRLCSKPTSIPGSGDIPSLIWNRYYGDFFVLFYRITNPSRGYTAVSFFHRSAKVHDKLDRDSLEHTVHYSLPLLRCVIASASLKLLWAETIWIKLYM